VQKRKENASLIIELNSGFIGKIWDIEKKFNIDRRAVYYNCKKEKAILTREYKGLNFKKQFTSTFLRINISINTMFATKLFFSYFKKLSQINNFYLGNFFFAIIIKI
jgi:hypothetical protein